MHFANSTNEDTQRQAPSFSDAQIQQCPFPTYDRLRKECPVYRDPQTGNYILTRYADIRKALLTPKLFSSRAGAITMIESSPELTEIFATKGWPHRPAIQQLDPPEHRLKRSLVDRAFANWNVEKAVPLIEATINNLITGFEARGTCEFLSEFAVPLTMTVIAHQLGSFNACPQQFQHDIDRLRMWSDCMVEMLGPNLSPARARELVEEATAFQHFCAQNISRVQANPDDTLLSKLTAVVVDEAGNPDLPELIAIVRTLLVAGNETSRFALASGAMALIEDPDLAAEICGDQHLIDKFVEEVLRVASPVQTLFRTTTQDVELGGTVIPAGSKVEVRYGSANRDPAAFSCPAKLDVTRQAAQPHLAFGAGIHVCIGMQLARTELRLAFKHILARLQNFRMLHGSDSFSYSPIYISRGLTRLEMAFDRRFHAAQSNV